MSKFIGLFNHTSQKRELDKCAASPAMVAWIVSALLSHSVDGTFWRSVDLIPIGTFISWTVMCTCVSWKAIHATDICNCDSFSVACINCKLRNCKLHKRNNKGEV